MDTWGWSEQLSKAVHVKRLARSWPCKCQDVLFVTSHGKAALGASPEASRPHIGCGPAFTARLSPLTCSKLATGSSQCPHPTRSGSSSSNGASSHWWPWASTSWLGRVWRVGACLPDVGTEWGARPWSHPVSCWSFFPGPYGVRAFCGTGSLSSSSWPIPHHPSPGLIWKPPKSSLSRC